MKMLPLMTLTTVVLGASLAVSADDQAHMQMQMHMQSGAPGTKAPPGSDYYSALAAKVREVTEQYRDYSAGQLAAVGFFPATPCVSGPDHGAMGVHYINANRLNDVDANGQLDPSNPPVLIYEPRANGSQVLVGVEYVLPLAAWTNDDKTNGVVVPNPPDVGLDPNGPNLPALTPSVSGHLMNYQGQPNRYGLPNSFYLHIWAWRYNPEGLFADWNINVTCANQPPVR